MRRQRGGWEIRGGGGHGRRWKARGGHGKRWKAAGRCGGTADVPVAGDAAGLRKWREEEERSAGGMEAARARVGAPLRTRGIGGSGGSSRDLPIVVGTESFFWLKPVKTGYGPA